MKNKIGGSQELATQIIFFDDEKKTQPNINSVGFNAFYEEYDLRSYELRSHKFRAT